MDNGGQVDRTTRHRSRTVVGRFFRNPQTDELTLAQAPNAALWIYLGATALRWVAHPAGTGGTALTVISKVALTWWAMDEIARGDSLFRRFLGAALLVGIAVDLLVS